MTEPYAPELPRWRELAAHAANMPTIPRLFQTQPDRGLEFVAATNRLSLDYSRQRLDQPALDSLLCLAEELNIQDWIRRFFAGEPLNLTERRPALHMALRRSAKDPLIVSEQDVMELVEAERVRMRVFVDGVTDGVVTSAAGKRFTDIVNIGIGGSDLGIVMAVEALAEYRSPDLRCHFVSNVDGVALSKALRCCDPQHTLFVVCSKSFTTLETQTNALAARRWLLEHGGKAAVGSQFVAISTNSAAMDEFGIHPDYRFALWDWVGGRYSLWSAVGLTIALMIGWTQFKALLRGAREMDEHFCAADPSENLPILLALLGIWNRNFLGLPSLAVLPYDDRLARLPAFLQQLEMESNGKSVRRNGELSSVETCPVVWGEPGSNAQHSFYQLLHQGSSIAAMDFILTVRSGVGRQDQHDLAIANGLAQIQAFAEGRSALEVSSQEPALAQDLVPHKVHPGGRPSNLIVLQELDPGGLGQLIALYEHKVFVQGVVWNINSFDQWGVELGKRLATGLIPAVSDPADHLVSPLIQDALNRIKGLR